MGRNRLKAYRTWAKMKHRCTNPNSPKWHRYGGRGIGYHPDWEKFENFLRDMGEPDDLELQLDRIDNDKDYGPDNCRWASRKVQMNNFSLNVNVTYRGVTKTLTEWAELIGINYHTLRWRLKNDWPIERAFGQETKSIISACSENQNTL